MANRITQYQSKAEVRPLQGSFFERTTPDKWLPTDWLNLGNPVAKAGALTVLAVTTALAFVPLTTPQVSTWHPAIEQPVRGVRNQYLAPSFFAPDRQPQPRLDSWVPQSNQPQFDLRRTQYLDPFSFAPEIQPQPRLDSWFQLASEPVRDVQRKQYVPQSFAGVDPLAASFRERTTPDKWAPLSNQPQFDLKRLQYLYPSLSAPERQPDVRLDSWWQQASEPVRVRAKKLEFLGESDVQLTAAQESERVSVDKYDPGTQQPRFDVKRQQYTYEWSSFNPRPFPDTIYADRWWQQPNQPQFDVRHNQYLYQSYVGPDQQPKPRLDSWFQPASEPVRLGDSRIQRLGASELDLTPAQDTERTTADKWHPLSNQPLFDVRHTQYSFEFSFFNPKPFPSPVFADSWFQQASEPVRLAPSRRHLSEFAVSGNAAAERVSAEKWLPLGNQPQFGQARNQYLYPSYFGPDRQPTVALDWYQQPNQPVFDLRRTQYLAPSSFSPERQPVPPVTSWWQQPNQPRFDIRREQHLAPSSILPDLIRESLTVDKWWQQPNQPLFDRLRLQYGHQFSSFHPAPLPSEVGRASSSLSSASAIVASSENATAISAVAGQIADAACRLNSAEMVLSSTSAIITIDLISGN